MKIKDNITEAKLQDICGMYFRKCGFLTQEEVPFLFKVADLFCFNEGTGECVAVEVKIRNWREALAQALVYQLMADRVYIALNDNYINVVDRSLLTDKGVGLLSVSILGDVGKILDAPLSPRRWDSFTHKVVATVFPEKNSPGCLML